MSRVGMSARWDSEPMEVENRGRIDYHEAWARQRELADERAAGRGRDHLLLLEHPDVYTAGRRTAPTDLPVDGSPVVEVDRGGKITWHGPGQLVGYPIVRLAEPIDVVDYVRRLEEALIAVCAGLGLATGRVEGRSGVWVPATDLLPERKVAAIGVRVQRGVTLHGFALNCNPSLNGFNAIVPCGIPDAGVTTLSRELGREITISDVQATVAEAVSLALDGKIVVAERKLPHPAVVETLI